VADFFMPSSYLGALPSPWQHGDVGSVAVPGSAGFATNIFTIQASGSGITNQADSFHFIYQTLTGDGQIIACVTGVENTDPFAEAGVMVRETLATNSPFAFMAITPSSLATFEWRTATNQNSGQISPVALPTTNCWVKLVRSGNLLSGYYSTNGVIWLQSSSLSIAMQKTVYIGLASTANNNSTLNTTTFNQVQFSPSLLFTLSGNSLQFNWPTNFTLQSTTNLMVSNGWSNVSFTPTLTNGQYTLAIYTTNGQQFFRLKQ
jgi:regulation of enolase protein 1 (concanavalin A-like superfamily)